VTRADDVFVGVDRTPEGEAKTLADWMRAANTDAERHFDALLAERRAKGRATYGTGLTHDDGHDWNQEALEEALDLAQYLAAENLRLRRLLESK